MLDTSFFEEYDPVPGGGLDPVYALYEEAGITLSNLPDRKYH